MFRLVDGEARAANQRAVAANPAWGWVHAHTHARAGRVAEARKAAADLERQAKPDALNLALVYSVLGDKDAAFRWLEIAYEQRDPFVPWYVVHLLDPLRDDPRFESMVRRLKLQ